MESTSNNLISKTCQDFCRIDGKVRFQELGDINLSNHSYEIAERYYVRAIQLDPVCPELKIRLAHTFFHQQKYDQSKVLIEYLMSSDFESAAAFHLNACLLNSEARFDEAEESYLKALKLDRSIHDERLEFDLWGIR